MCTQLQFNHECKFIISLRSWTLFGRRSLLFFCSCKLFSGANSAKKKIPKEDEARKRLPKKVQEAIKAIVQMGIVVDLSIVLDIFLSLHNTMSIRLEALLGEENRRKKD